MTIWSANGIFHKLLTLSIMDYKGLTERQKDLLKAIISEFMETAEAVGSIYLSAKYDLGVSSATIRNEMTQLVKEGYLRKLHSSSGRLPTARAFKFFIKQLLEELEEVELMEEQLLKQRISQSHNSVERVMLDSSKFLARVTKNAGVALGEKAIYYSGITDILTNPEYHKHSTLYRLFSILEDYRTLERILSKYEGENYDNVRVLIGKEDLGMESLECVAIVFSECLLANGQKGYIAVIGPNRMDYASVIPAVRRVCQLINQNH